MRCVAAAALATVLASLVSCATYREELARSGRALDANEHDRALALLRDLEPDLPRLSQAEQARYAYLRGMTDYRIGHRADARHWLAIARAYDDHGSGIAPGSLPVTWTKRMGDALAELEASAP